MPQNPKSLVRWFLLISLVNSPVYSQQMPQLNVSGRSGNDGRHGQSYSGTASTGQEGRNGGDAGEAEEGQTAGNILVKMRRPQKGVLTLNAVIKPAGQNHLAGLTENYEVSLATEGYIALDARGGHGGRGGNGGNGEDGGKGSDGDAATRYSHGSNGDDGKAGGNAGEATSGKKAGDGGNITIELPEVDTALLMLVEQNVSGGRGGVAGKYGTPGAGGRGGSGGSSYSWSETTYDVTTSTDGDGNTTTSTTTNTQHFSNPGGSSGNTGPSGHGHRNTVFNGENGKDGKYLIKVFDAQGNVQTYTERYDLKLVSYNIVPEDRDGVLEPGERVSVKNIVVKNPSTMPTPAFTKIRLFLENSELSIADSIALQIPKALAPGEEFIFSESDLSFVIKNNILKGAAEERTIWQETVRPLAQMTEVNRQFREFSTNRPIEITYPIEIESVTATRSLAPGESSKIMMRIKNISERDFGSSSALKRQLEVLFKQKQGDLSTTLYTLTGPDGKPWDMSTGVVHSIAHLKAGESVLVEGSITISTEAEAYRGADLSFRLDLDTPTSETKKSSVQERVVGFRVSQTYQMDPLADVLLVVNNETDREIIENFKRVAAQFGMKINIWDISYYGELSLTNMLKHGSSLASDFEGKTIVILNNTFASTRGKVSAREMLSTAELAAAASYRGINTLLASGNLKDAFGGIEILDLDNGASSTKITTWSWAKKAPSAEVLEAASKKFLSNIVNSRNLNQYQIVSTYDPTLIKKGWLGIGRIWSLGSVRIIRSLSQSDGQIVTLNTPHLDSINSQDILSPSFRLGLALATPLKTRLRLLASHLLKRDNSELVQARILIESLLINIASEQRTARRTSYIPLKSMAMDRLPLLKELKDSSAFLKSTQLTPEGQTLLMELYNGLGEMTKGQSKWWEYMIPFRTNPKVTGATNDLVQSIQRSLYEVTPWYRKAREGELSRAQLKDLKTNTAPMPIPRPNDLAVVNSGIKSGLISAKDGARKMENFLQVSDSSNSLRSALLKDSQDLKSIPGSISPFCRFALGH